MCDVNTSKNCNTTTLPNSHSKNKPNNGDNTIKLQELDQQPQQKQTDQPTNNHNNVNSQHIDQQHSSSRYSDEIMVLKRDFDLCREGKSVDHSEVENLDKHLVYPVSGKDILERTRTIRIYLFITQH